MGQGLEERWFSGLVGGWDLLAQLRKQVVLTRWGGGEEESQVRLGDTREGVGRSEERATFSGHATWHLGQADGPLATWAAVRSQVR